METIVMDESWFAGPALCERCTHPAWVHGPGGICSECDATAGHGACGLLALYGFDLAALPLVESLHASA